MLRLVWRPGELAEAAMVTPTWACAVIGVLSISMLPPILIRAVNTEARDLASAALEFIQQSFVVVGGCTVLIAMPLLVCVALPATLRAREDPHWAARSRVLFLGVVPFVVPVSMMTLLFWASTAFTNRSSGGAGVELGRSFVGVSACALPAIAPLYMWLVIRQGRRAAAMAEPPRDECAHCGYLREGLATPRCPECGLGWKADPPML